MGTVDAMMVGHYSPEALAAVLLGNVYSWGLLVFGFGVMMCLDPIVSQAHGAGDRPAIRLALQRGLLLAGLLSIPFVALFLDAEPGLRLLRQRPDVVPLAAAWVRATAPGVPAFFAMVAMRQTLVSTGITRPILVAVVTANLVNLVCNRVLVYGALGLPALGAVGSGCSTSIARLTMAGMLAVAVSGVVDAPWRPARGLLDARALGRMVAIGVPIGFQLALESWVFVTTSFLIGAMGREVFSAHQIAMNLASLAFMVPTGIGTAAAARVGSAVGRGAQADARRAAFTAMTAGSALMFVSAALFAFVPRLLAHAYTTEAAVVDVAARLLPIAALFQIVDGTQAVGCGVLRGIADARAAAWINFVGYWILGLPIGLALAYRAGLGPFGLWWGLTAGLFVVAALIVGRVLSRFSARAPTIRRVSIG